MSHDAELLRQYAEEHSEAAFAEFVRRNANLVYGSALRRLGGDTHAASDVVQKVFIAVARNARALARSEHPTSWLFAATRNAALNHMREEIRRQQREQIAYAEREALEKSGGELNWEQLRPVIDETMDELREADREAVLLRIFENRPFAEIGERLRLTENAARMRVERALGQLRSRLAQRGIKSTAAGLALAVSGYAATSAPASVVSAATSAALAAGTPGMLASIGMALAKAKLALLGVTVAVVATLVVTTREASPTEEPATATQPGQAAAESATTPSLDRSATGQSAKSAKVDARAARIAYERALKLENGKEYSAALALYSQAISHDPKMAEAYFARGRVYHTMLPREKRDYAKARDDYSRCLEIMPRDYAARYNRALCLEGLHHYKLAVADYTALIEGDVDFSRWSAGKDNALALVFESRGRLRQESQREPAAALADYAAALQLNPKSDTLHYRRALAYQAMKDYAAAEREFTAAFERSPDSPDLLASWAWQLATAPDANQRDGKAALEFATRATERLRSDNPEHLEAFAAALAENRRFDDAVAAQRKAIVAAKSPQQLKRVPEMEARLSLYRERKPYRDEAKPVAAPK